jgi:hypothetical protein
VFAVVLFGPIHKTVATATLTRPCSSVILHRRDGSDGAGRKPGSRRQRTARNWPRIPQDSIIYPDGTVLSSRGQSTWGPLGGTILLGPFLGLPWSIWRLAKHYGTYREWSALPVRYIWTLVVVLVVVVSVASSLSGYAVPRAAQFEASIRSQL